MLLEYYSPVEFYEFICKFIDYTSDDPQALKMIENQNISEF